MKSLPCAAFAVCGLALAFTGCKNLPPFGPTSTVDDQAPLFRRMDTNRDGKLSRAEFSAGFADAVLTVYNQPATGSVTADQWNGIERPGARAQGGGFAALDRNGDGKLTRDELAGGPTRDTVVNRIFDRIDKDHDGSLSLEEGRPSGLDRTPQQRAAGAGL